MSISAARPALRILSSVVVVGLATAFASTAHADAAAPRVNVTVFAEGTGIATLEERAAGANDEGWREVCRAPCKATVTADPAAEHRIVDGKIEKRVVLDGDDGSSLEVRYVHGSKAWIPLVAAGAAIAGAGAIVVVGTYAWAIGNGIANRDPAPCEGNAACERMRDADRASSDKQVSTQLEVGGVLILVGGAVALSSLLVQRTKAKVSLADEVRAPAAARAPSTAVRAPSWARPNLPTPPNHVTLVNLRF